jgi:hypothetical protein
MLSNELRENLQGKSALKTMVIGMNYIISYGMIEIFDAGYGSFRSRPV